MKKILFVLVLFLMILTSCAINPPTGAAGSENGVTRYTDTEAGVVCWLYSSSYGVGIDCIPMSNTLLR